MKVLKLGKTAGCPQFIHDIPKRGTPRQPGRLQLPHLHQSRIEERQRLVAVEDRQTHRQVRERLGHRLNEPGQGALGRRGGSGIGRETDAVAVRPDDFDHLKRDRFRAVVDDEFDPRLLGLPGQRGLGVQAGPRDDDIDGVVGGDGAAPGADLAVGPVQRPVLGTIPHDDRRFVHQVAQRGALPVLILHQRIGCVQPFLGCLQAGVQKTGVSQD